MPLIPHEEHRETISTHKTHGKFKEVFKIMRNRRYYNITRAESAKIIAEAYTNGYHGNINSNSNYIILEKSNEDDIIFISICD